LVERTIAGNDAEALRAACHAVAIHPSAAWGEAGWRLLAAAARHEHPALDQYTVHSVRDSARVPDIETTSINCVRGAVGAALAALAWNDADRAADALPLARTLVSDPHPAVRMAAAHAAFGIFTTDKDEGAALLGTLLGHTDDNLLVGHWVNKLIQSVRWSHPGSLDAVFERMVVSGAAEVSKRGASWVTAECFQRHGASRSLYEQCSAGTRPQRMGVAETLGQLLAHAELDDTSALESALVRCFDDGDNDVRSAAAAVFRDNRILETPAGPRLALAFVGSVAFTEHSENLIWPLAHQAIDLTAYAPAVFASADRFAAELAPETRSMANRNGLAGRDLSALLLRLYDAAVKGGDPTMAKSCLDRWDGLLANRVGEAEEHLEAFAT
jgi:hypothetical protein